MHTVIITNARSARLLEEYETLFQPFVETGDISFCQWNESGTDLLSAVPELYRTIQGKHEWRALVAIQPGEDDKTAGDRKNPFDFLTGDGEDLHLQESPVPLIRLCHMLAGFPALGIKAFRKAYVYHDKDTGKECHWFPDEEEPGQAEEKMGFLMEEYSTDLRLKYVEEEYTDEEKSRYSRLERKYTFPEERPREILLISTRQKTGDETKQKILRVWQNNRETESSDFWKRNNYPNTCRFLCYDLTNTENSLYARELMTFWLAVLTVATNRIAPSTLQAYRLYRLDIDVDKPMLGKALSAHISRMLAARNTVRERMSQRPNFSFGEDDVLVTEQNVPVVFDLSDGSDLQVHTRLGLSRDCPMDEGRFWAGQMQETRKNLDRFLKAPRRAVDVAAEYARDRAESFLGREYELDKFQKEDLRETVSQLEWDVVTAETRDILDTRKYREEMEEADRAVRRCIETRMRKKAVLATGGAALLVYFCGWLPYLINAGRQGEKVFVASLGLCLGTAAAVALGGILALLVLRGRLKTCIGAFNGVMQRITERVNAGAKKFEQYLTDVCTYMKAQSILSGMTLKNQSATSSQNLLRAHEKALTRSIQKESDWCGAFGVPLDTEPLTGSSLFFSAEVLPRANPIYRLVPNDVPDSIPINDTGDRATAPYKFVSRITVEREELYDPVKGDGEE